MIEQLSFLPKKMKNLAIPLLDGPSDDEIKTLLADTLYLAVDANLRTKYAVFCDFYGHVDTLDIRIMNSKEDFNTSIFKTTFKITPIVYPLEDPILVKKEFNKITKEKLKQLKTIFFDMLNGKQIENYPTEDISV